jgi:opacity protein-like surface antigen
MRYLGLVLTIAFAMVAGTAAASAQGMYAGGNLGVNLTHDGEFAGTGVDTESDIGYAILGYVGVDMGSYRLEGELSYRSNDIDNIGGLDFSPSSFTTTAIMGNALYDFDSGSAFVPYIGAGIGIGFSTMEILGIDGDVTGFAGQLIAGGAYRMSETLELTVDYRLFTMLSPDYEFAGGDIEQDYYNSTFMLGLRTRF